MSNKKEKLKRSDLIIGAVVWGLILYAIFHHAIREAWRSICADPAIIGFFAVMALIAAGVIYGILIVAKTFALLLSSFFPSDGSRLASGLIGGCAGAAILIECERHWSKIAESSPENWIGVAIGFVGLVFYCRHISVELEICTDPVFISLQRDEKLAFIEAWKSKRKIKKDLGIESQIKSELALISELHEELLKVWLKRPSQSDRIEQLAELIRKIDSIPPDKMNGNNWSIREAAKKELELIRQMPERPSTLHFMPRVEIGGLSSH